MTTRADTLLKRYREKRDFTRTAEPEGGGKTAGGWPSRYRSTTRGACITTSASSGGGPEKLGGDARPEPRPGRQRLAVRVEDHPLDYGTSKARSRRANTAAAR